MVRVLLISILWFSVVEAPAAVVVTQVQKRLYDYLGDPRDKTLEVNQDGTPDFQFSFTTYVTTDIPVSSGVDILNLRSTGGFDSSSRTVATQAGSLLGTKIFPAGGQVALWPDFDFGHSISSRGYSFRNPSSPVSFSHLGGALTDGYLGFRLPSSNGFTFGYLHFQFIDWTTPKQIASAFAGNPILVGWALESEANVAIKVVPIPEPSPVGLAAACGLVMRPRFRSKKIIG